MTPNPYSMTKTVANSANKVTSMMHATTSTALIGLRPENTM